MARIYSLKAGSKLPETIISIAKKRKILSARLDAIGGVDRLQLAYFNHKTKKYEVHDHEEFLEVTGLIGNISQKEGKPFLHAHGTFGRKDLSVLGGHIMTARVFPLLEVAITPTKNTLHRFYDEDLGLNVIKSS